MTRYAFRYLALGLAILVVPAAAHAQSLSSGTIAGVVKDESGGVLPGVTVEAASPALIEKVRTVATDAQGVYRIVDLRPGVYTVTFTLQGFSTLRREGIELTTGFTATVNADMTVGALAETITVSVAAPLVDTQNVNAQRVFAREVTEQLPSAATLNQYATLIPGAVLTSGASAQDVGGSRGEFQTGFTIHGARTGDFQQMRDGMFFGTLVAAGNKMSSLNQATVDEVTVQTSGATAEAESGGVLVNIVPRDGGNIFSGSFTANFANNALQSSNLDDELRARGVTVIADIRKRYDAGGGVGGPIMRDKLWFFASSRYWITSTYVPGNYFNATQGTLFYTPDLNRPLYDENYYWDNRVRLTWQAAERHKITATWGVERNCNCLNNVALGMRDAAASGSAFYWPNRQGQATWNSPVTNRLLFEAGVTYVSFVQQRLRVGSTPGDPAVLDQSRNYRYGNHRFGYGLSDSFGYQKPTPKNAKFAVSYVTGSHAFKTGLQYLHTSRKQFFYQDGGPYADRSYTFLVRTPVSVTYYAGPIATDQLQQTVGLYAQDQWNVRRLTLNLGVRFDYLNGRVRDQHMPAGTFVPARDFAAVKDVPSWSDLNPRIGAAYDVFGTGRTAVKAFFGRFVNFEAFGISTANNPANLLVLSATRSWTDVNGDYIPQESELGPLSDSAFGQLRRATTRYADEVLRGFGVRPYNWQTSVQFQHEIGSGVALNVGYFRTWYGNFTVTDNLAVTPADYDPYCVTAPTHPDLPAGVSGQQICGLYDLKPAKFGQVDNLVTHASNYGDYNEVFDGIDVSVNMRFGTGGILQGGLATGSQGVDKCFVVDSPQDMYQCDVSPPWSGGTQFKFFAVYPLPWDLQLSGTYQDASPIPTNATLVATNASIAPSLGRNLGACGTRPVCTTTTTVEMVPPGTYFRESRIRQLDIRVTRNFRWNAARIQPQFDLYNAFNANPVLGMNTRYGPAWQRVTSVLGPRTVKFGVNFTF
ncbi:MAG: TonB-dependent receptor [Acidobacteria bacterium]|nr:TonB-dependent receptor [Acidobacteriota bacterium]